MTDKTEIKERDLENVAGGVHIPRPYTGKKYNIGDYVQGPENATTVTVYQISYLGNAIAMGTEYVGAKLLDVGKIAFFSKRTNITLDYGKTVIPKPEWVT